MKIIFSYELIFMEKYLMIYVALSYGNINDIISKWDVLNANYSVALEKNEKNKKMKNFMVKNQVKLNRGVE